jgi:hypothetical protein
MINFGRGKSAQIASDSKPIADRWRQTTREFVLGKQSRAWANKTAPADIELTAAPR